MLRLIKNSTISNTMPQKWHPPTENPRRGAAIVYTDPRVLWATRDENLFLKCPLKEEADLQTIIATTAELIENLYACVYNPDGEASVWFDDENQELIAAIYMD